MFSQTFNNNSTNDSLGEDDVFIDINSEIAIAADADALIGQVVDKLLAGQISPTLRNEIAGMLALINGPNSEALRVAETIYLVVTSPEYAFQR
jgi:hypothetical protein